jgi:FKBP-type peptidyl-prolyl cis-trans isomerase SlyD
MSIAIANGATVQIEYTLKDDSGAVLDSSEGGVPLTSVHGHQQIIPGLEHALDGMRPGDETHLTIGPEEAYGPVDPAAVAEVPKGAVPPDALAPGVELVAKQPDGGTRIVRVKDVGDETVTVDLNHPLAGKTLHFDVRIVDVAPPAVR